MGLYEVGLWKNNYECEISGLVIMTVWFKNELKKMQGFIDNCEC